MKIKTFKVERWMNEYEDDAVYNLAETCIDSMTVEELLTVCGEDPASYWRDLSDIRLSYSHIFGSPEFLQGVAAPLSGFKTGTGDSHPRRYRCQSPGNYLFD